MAMVNTVLGAITAGCLGNVLMHEHVFCSAFSKNYNGLDRNLLAERGRILLEEANKAGVTAILDATPLQLQRDLPLMREVSLRSGVHIIACTGTYHFYCPELDEMSAARIAGYMIDAFDHGFGDTGIYPGAIKCAVQDEITPYHLKLLQATAMAHQETGLLVTTHCTHATALNQQKILLDMGVRPEKLVIGHVGDYYDPVLQLELLRNGSFIGIDRMHDLGTCARVITEFCVQGFADRMVLGHDRGIFMDFRQPQLSAQEVWQGQDCADTPDGRRIFLVIHDELLPAIRRTGVTDRQVEGMLRQNPARCLG